jgi:cell division protein FtsZ
MSHNLPIKIKLIGIGGAGGNTISKMALANIKGIELIAINTDLQDLKNTKADIKVAIGRKITRGFGTGMNPNLGRKAAEEDKDKIEKVLEGAQMVFITAGQGGGTGSGVSPLVAKIAKEKGILTLAIVTLPFSFEGLARQLVAKKWLVKLKENVDALIAINNDKILEIKEGKATLKQAFDSANDVLLGAIRAITDLITLPGIINVDFADIKAILKDSGTAFFGVGIAREERRAQEALKLALNSPFLEKPFCQEAKGVLFTLSGNKDISLAEIEETANIITQKLNQSAKIIFGAVQDEKLKKGELKVTVIATGF